MSHGGGSDDPSSLAQRTKACPYIEYVHRERIPVALHVLECDDDFGIAFDRSVVEVPVVALKLFLDNRFEAIEVPVNNEIPLLEGNPLIARNAELIH